VAGQRSGDNVGDAQVDNPGDVVLEAQFAPLQPGDLELVAGRLGAKRPNALVELAMLGLERFEPWARLIVTHRVVILLRIRVWSKPGHKRWLGRASRRMVQSIKTKRPIRDLLRVGDIGWVKGLAPMDKAVVEELESKHAAVHALIEEEEHRTHPDEDLLHRLKKEKLRLKDELAGHVTH
jgi:uncharacterized protein YdcH (DUF465 family)